MLTGSQIRAARAALGWSATRLADAAGVAMKTVARLRAGRWRPAEPLLNVGGRSEGIGSRRNRVHRHSRGWPRHPRQEIALEAADFVRHQGRLWLPAHRLHSVKAGSQRRSCHGRHVLSQSVQVSPRRVTGIRARSPGCRHFSESLHTRRAAFLCAAPHRMTSPRIRPFFPRQWDNF